MKSPNFVYFPWLRVAQLLGTSLLIGACSVEHMETHAPSEAPTSDRDFDFPDIELDSVEDALTLNTCPTNTSKGCWERRGNGQQFDFTYLDGVKFFQRAISPSLVYTTHSDNDMYFPIGWKTNVAGFPSGVKSITAHKPAAPTGRVYVLAGNNVTYYSTGNVPPNYQNQDFSTYSMAVEAKKTDGSNLCLNEIEFVQTPAPVPTGILVALGCDNRLYYKSGTKWTTLQSHSGYASLPTNVTYTHISRTGLGATFVTSTNDIWLAGHGTFSYNDGITYSAPKKLPALKDTDGNSMVAKWVGGRYVITNKGNGTCPGNGGICDGDAHRVYYYDIPSNSWKRFTAGVPWTPDFIETGYCDPNKWVGQCTATTADDNRDLMIKPVSCPYPLASQEPTCCCKNAFPFFDGIQEVGGAPALHHANSWVFRYRP